MTNHPRTLEAAIRELALDRGKMAMVSGPRQAGKTTLAKRLLRQKGSGVYRTWDDVAFRRAWVKDPASLIPEAPRGSRSRAPPLLILDEIHKARGWKGTLKGLYDVHGEEASFLVTGSARLNVYRRGGDSLLGRYLHFRLHPFSVGELVRGGAEALAPDDVLSRLFSSTLRAPQRASAVFERLLTFGGFPEPYVEASRRIAALWRRGRVEKIIREDLRDLSRIPELSRVELLAALLPERVGSLLSVQSLREDLEVAHATVSRWLRYLAELYYLYELKPHSRSLPRSLRKEGKLYLWDWTEVTIPGPRFENLVAGHLLKACHHWTDTGEGTFDLRFLRDKEKREIDFLIVREGRPWLAVEAKMSDDAPNPQWKAFTNHLGPVPFVTVTRAARPPRRHDDGSLAIPAHALLALFP